MELVTVKIIVLAISGLVRIFFGIIPLLVMKLLEKSWTKKKERIMKKVISFLMFFGGGVLLATCFLHMMPEVRDNFREAEPELELPLSEIIFLAGFFLVYMIEDVVHSIIHQRRYRKQAKHGNEEAKMHQKQSNINANQGLSSGTTVVMVGEGKRLHNNDGGIINARTTNGNNITVACNGVSSPATPSFPLSLSTVENGVRVNANQLRETSCESYRKIPSPDDVPDNRTKNANGLGGYTNGGFVPEKFEFDAEWLKDNIGYAGLLPRGRRSICDGLTNNGTSETNFFRRHSMHNLGRENNNRANGQVARQQPFHNYDHPHQNHRHVTESNNHNHNDHSHSHMPIPMGSDADQSIGAEIRNILIVIAISFHGIFEGMAIGLQGTVNDVWYLFLAVSLHECTILFCIGVELISSKTKVFRMILYILVVSLVSPVGIAIGIAITEKASGGVIHQALIIGCFQGLAAGTLLYVCFFEIFQEEGKKLHRKCYHILVAVLGFVLMGSLEFMGGHHHGDEAHNHSSGGNNNCSTSGGHDHGTHSHDDHGHDHDHSHDHDHFH